MSSENDPAPQRMSSFAEFWPYYLREHSHPRTRLLHYLGTTGVLLVATVAVVTGRWAWLWAMPVLGYGFAWVAHFFVERNRPATFTHPLWSLRADFVMYGKMLSGQMPAELRRHVGP